MKDQIFNMLQAGIPLETIYGLLELKDSDIKALEADATFVSRVRFYLARYEQSLLDRMERIMDINESKGISTEVRWLLSRRFADRYGAKQTVAFQNTGALPPAQVGVYDEEPEDELED